MVGGHNVGGITPDIHLNIGTLGIIGIIETLNNTFFFGPTWDAVSLRSVTHRLRTGTWKLVEDSKVPFLLEVL